MLPPPLTPIPPAHDTRRPTPSETWLPRAFVRMDRLRARLDRGGLAEQPLEVDPGLGCIEALCAATGPNDTHLWIAAGAQVQLLSMDARTRAPRPAPRPGIRLPGRVKALAAASDTDGHGTDVGSWAATDAGLFRLTAAETSTTNLEFDSLLSKMVDARPWLSLAFDAHTGTLWVGGPAGLLAANAGEATPHPAPGAVCGLVIEAATTPEADLLWLATDLGHLYRVRRDARGGFDAETALSGSPWLSAPGSAFKGLGLAGAAPGRGVWIRSLRSLRQVSTDGDEMPTLARWRPPGDGALLAATAVDGSDGASEGQAVLATTDSHLWLLGPATDAHRTRTEAPLSAHGLAGRQWRVTLSAPARALVWLPKTRQLVVGGADGRLRWFAHLGPAALTARLDGVLSALVERVPGPALVDALMAAHALDPWSEGRRRTLLATLPAVLSAGAPAGWEALVHAAIFPPGPDTDALLYRALGALRRAIDPATSGTVDFQVRARVLRLLAALEAMRLAGDPTTEAGAGVPEGRVPVGALEALGAGGAELEPVDTVRLSWAATLATTGIDAAWRRKPETDQATGVVTALFAEPGEPEGRPLLVSARGIWRADSEGGWLRCPLPLPWGAPELAVLVPGDAEDAAHWSLWLICGDGDLRQVPAEALKAPEGSEPAQRHLRGRLASRTQVLRGRPPQAAPATALAVDAHRRLLVGDAAGGLTLVSPEKARATPALARTAAEAWGSGGAIHALASLQARGVAGRADLWVVARGALSERDFTAGLWALVERPDGLHPVAHLPLDLNGLKLCAWPAAGLGTLVTADARGRVQVWVLGDMGAGWGFFARAQMAVPGPVRALAPVAWRSEDGLEPRLIVACADTELRLFDRDGWPAGQRAVPGLSVRHLCPRPASPADAHLGIATQIWLADEAGEGLGARVLDRAFFDRQAEALAGPPTEGALLAGRGQHLRSGWLRRRSVTATLRFNSDFPLGVVRELNAWLRRGRADALATDVVCGLVARLVGAPRAGLRGGLAHLFEGENLQNPKARWAPVAQVLSELWLRWGAPASEARRRVMGQTISALAAGLADPRAALNLCLALPIAPEDALIAALSHDDVRVRLGVLRALSARDPSAMPSQNDAPDDALAAARALYSGARLGPPLGASSADAGALADAEARVACAWMWAGNLPPFALVEAVLAGAAPGTLARAVAQRLRAVGLTAAQPPTLELEAAALALCAAADLEAGLRAPTAAPTDLVRALVQLTEYTGVFEATLQARAVWPQGSIGPVVRSGSEPSADATLPYGAALPPHRAAPSPQRIGLAFTLADAARLLAVADLDAMQALRLDGGPSPSAFGEFEAMAQCARVYWRAKHEDIEVRPFGALEHAHFADLVAAVAAEPEPQESPALVDRLAHAARKRWRAVVAHERENVLLADFSLTLERTLLAEDRLSADVLDASAAREAAAEDAEWHAAAVRGLFVRLALLGEVRCGLLVYSRPRDEGPPILVRAAIGWPPDPDRGTPWPPGWDHPQAVEHLDAEAAVRWLEAWPTLVRAHAEPLRVGAGRQRRTGGMMLFGWDARGDAGRARYKQQAVVRDLLLDTLSIKSMASAQRAFIGRFFSMVAHNLRNPAFVLRSGLKMLEEGRYALASPDDLKNKHAELYRHAVHMDGIIDSILQFRQQHLAPDLQPVAVAAVVRDVVKAVRRELEGRRITLVYEGWQALAEVAIHTDHTWLYEIVQNLLNNATKYAPVGSTVQVRLTPRLQARPPRMELTVTDEGPGVPQAERAAIFEMFFRGALAEATRTQGLGLGLYISRAYVEALGGGARLSVDDNPEGHGARFTLIVPDQAPAGSPVHGAHEPVAVGHKALKP